MKSTIIIILFAIIATFYHCSPDKKTLKESDRLKIELLLSKYKRFAFIDLYEKSIEREEKRFDLKKCDSLFDLTSSDLYHEYTLPKNYYTDENPSYSDKNYNGLISRWLLKDYPPYMPTDDPNIKTTMVFKKALDFYESKDLANHIDSLRISFSKRQIENKFDGLDFME